MRTSDLFYFAYGSNMLTSRIHLVAASAVFCQIGVLKNYRLDFDQYSKKWKGCVGTCVSDDGYEIWGVIWKVEKSDIEALNRQGGIHDGMYEQRYVEIITNSGAIVKCMTYQLQNLPVKEDILPFNRQPSKLYMDILINGASEHHIPPSYVEYLKEIPNNGLGEGDSVQRIMMY